MEIDVRSLFAVLYQRMRIILISVLGMAVVFGAYTGFVMAPTYRSTFQIYVSNYTDLSNMPTSPNASTGSLSASQLLVQEYITVIRNDLVLGEIVDNLRGRGYVMTTVAVRNALSLTEVGDTAMMNVSVSTTDPNLSKAVCDAVAEVVPDKLREIVEQGSAKVMAPARIGVKDGPSLMRNTLLGALLGGVLSCAVVLALFFFDNTVSGERDIKQRLDVIVLGEVPSLRPAKGRTRGLGKGGTVSGK